ncbi:hypothetical protein [Mesonia aestuariivivens]|uniref:DUF3300 domain-containing protein n=1 Tax=Mesonia aestuariivivens TaxID=2796128 RepID=A0ABS6W0K0_9FLAO|nr:hypothetical protein [Mesonia aestuariivivens]MBW2960673.1 hypothetical protein [Mesonia aestuariivivens]
MKNLITLVVLTLVTLTASAENKKSAISTYNYGYNSSIIFVEKNIEFAIYPDGQFDFYYQPRNNFNFNIHTPQVNISFNHGYNYDPYVQYDDYGAVIQIESVPIYYDYYGRIIKAGNTPIHYNQFGRLAQVGGLSIFYNSYGNFAHFTGYINTINRRYVHRSWHEYYTTPPRTRCVVFSQPYRTYYQPNRVNYRNFRNHYNVYRSNRSNFYTPAQRVAHYTRGTKTNSKRALVQNDNNKVRTNTSSARRNGTNRNNTSRTRNYHTREIRSNDRALSVADRVPTNNSSQRQSTRNRSNVQNRKQASSNINTNKRSTSARESSRNMDNKKPKQVNSRTSSTRNISRSTVENSRNRNHNSSRLR